MRSGQSIPDNYSVVFLLSLTAKLRSGRQMKTSPQIVSGGGWIKQQALIRPKARLFSILSLIWLGVAIAVLSSLCAQWPEFFASRPWLCAALLAPEPLLMVLAVMFWLTEAPRMTTTYSPLPDHDLRNLH
jgi:hypothetical protein